MDAYTAFLHGYKPSYLCPQAFREHEALSDQGYPHTWVLDDLTLFFLTTELKNKYLNASQGLHFHSPEFKEVLGEALGFPPIATRFFAETMRNPDLEKEHAAFQYAGRSFAGHIQDAQNIAEWLWRNVNFPPSEVQMTYQNNQYALLPDSPLPAILVAK